MVTPEQIDIIKTTWKIPAANPVDSGEVILVKFFEKFPHNQQKFLAFKNLPLDSLKVSDDTCNMPFYFNLLKKYIS